MRRIVLLMLLFLAAGAGHPSTAAAATQEEVFQSLNQNLGQEADYGKLIPWLLGCAGVAVAVAIFRQRQKSQAIPKALNHPGKLVKEVVKLVEMDPAEMKKIKALAAELECESPLTLLLCPSLRQESGDEKAKEKAA